MSEAERGYVYESNGEFKEFLTRGQPEVREPIFRLPKGWQTEDLEVKVVEEVRVWRRLIPKLNVTPSEHVEIERMVVACEVGLDSFDEERWVAWMAERFGVPRGRYQLVVHRDVPGIPCGTLERVSE